MPTKPKSAALQAPKPETTAMTVPDMEALAAAVMASIKDAGAEIPIISGYVSTRLRLAMERDAAVADRDRMLAFRELVADDFRRFDMAAAHHVEDAERRIALFPAPEQQATE